jgi:hypothetical protein
MMTYRKNGSSNEYLVDFLERRIGIAYPLSFWLDKINCYEEINYGVDYPYKKYLVFYDHDNEEYLNITLTALDINSENYNCSHPVKNASALLSAMNLPTEGLMHAEKFYHKLKTYCEIISYDEKKIGGLKVMLSTLEALCEHCVKYECEIEWKIIGADS